MEKAFDIKFWKCFFEECLRLYFCHELKLKDDLLHMFAFFFRFDMLVVTSLGNK